MMDFFLFGSGNIARKFFLSNRNNKNFRLYWAYEPNWDNEWSDNSTDNSFEPADNIFQIKNIENLLELIKKIKPDIGLIIGSKWIFTNDFISQFKIGLFNYHPAPLPCYRGAGIFSWQILNGEKEACVTIHKITEKIDEGGIVIQKKKYLNEKPTPQDFISNIENLALQTITLFINEFSKDNTFENLDSQNSIESSYFPPLRANINGAINWEWDGIEIEIFIRAFSRPYSGAFTYYGNLQKEIRFLKSSFTPSKNHHPFSYGLLIVKTSNAIQIIVKGGILFVNIDDIDSDEVDIISKLKLGGRFWISSDLKDRSLHYRFSQK
jgi:methionyl-tRNA formyltransferase